MADVVDKATRSRMMSGIKAKDTAPEMSVRRFLHSHGFRYRLHAKDLPGKPDIVLPKYRAVIFVHGCFWHQHPGCKDVVLPKSNTKFWKDKLEGNVKRDAVCIEELGRLGWRCLVIWECETGYKKILNRLVRRVQRW